MSSLQSQKAEWNLDSFNQILSLANAKNKTNRLAHIDAISDNSLICLVEFIFNMLNGSIPLSREHIQKLRPETENLRQLSIIRDLDKTREFLVQTGGNPVAVLLPVLISAASTILQHVLQ